MSVDAFERLFSMSAFEAVRMIRSYRLNHPDLLTSDLIALVRSVEPDAAAHDYGAGQLLDTLVEPTVGDVDPTRFYRACVEAVVHQNGVWTKIIPRGRRQFVDKLERDEEQCFRAAGLLIDPPTDEIIEWWDRAAGTARLAADYDKLRRARYAERLSLDHERQRLQSLRINLKPVWVSIEDNTAGYDILSYDSGPVNPVNRLIEVKSTVASPLRFFLTRHEWDTANRFGSSYFFHLWDLQANRLYERRVVDIAPHIPTDNERGRWSVAQVPIIGLA